MMCSCLAADAVCIRGVTSQRILRHSTSSAAVMDAECESSSVSLVIEDSVRGADRESPVCVVDVEAS